MSTSIESQYLQQGILPEKGRVIYDAFDPKEYEEIDAKQIAELKSEFKISDDEKIVCNIGRITPWKGQDVFLKAMGNVIKINPNTKALIVGPTNSSVERKIFFKKLKKMVDDLELNNHVLFTDFRSDIPQIMITSDIIVHSSSEPEPFGRVIVEGMLAGKPVVATAAGGVLDIIENEVTGMLVPIKDAEAMANAITFYLNNHEATKRISDTAKEDARKRFNVKQHVQAVQKVYHEVLE
jgi:glycosyltransferase involved in cell wall biosynthesis